MSLLRAMLLLCITILLSVGALLFSNYTKDRFEIVPLKDGVFIFDRQSTASNFCNDSKCIVLSSEFLIPKKVLVSEIPGVVTKTQLQVQNPTAQVTPAPAPVPAPTLTPAPQFNQSNIPQQNNNLPQSFDSPPQNNPNFGAQFNQNDQQNNNDNQNNSNDQNQDNFQNQNNFQN